MQRRAFRAVASAFDDFKDPLVYTPGDNEWTDCHRVNNGAYDPLERLEEVRSTFFAEPGSTLGRRPMRVQYQRSLVENVRWIESRVAFATLHVIGSNNGLAPYTGLGLSSPTAEQAAEVSARVSAVLSWIDATFHAAESANLEGVVLVMQADTWDPVPSSAQAAITERIAARTATFDGEVLLLQGDSHQFVADNPLGLANFTRIVSGFLYRTDRVELLPAAAGDPVLPDSRSRDRLSGSTTRCQHRHLQSQDPQRRPAGRRRPLQRNGRLGCVHAGPASGAVPGLAPRHRDQHLHRRVGGEQPLLQRPRRPGGPAPRAGRLQRRHRRRAGGRRRGAGPGGGRPQRLPSPRRPVPSRRRPLRQRPAGPAVRRRRPVQPLRPAPGRSAVQRLFLRLRWPSPDPRPSLRERPASGRCAGHAGRPRQRRLAGGRRQRQRWRRGTRGERPRSPGGARLASADTGESGRPRPIPGQQRPTRRGGRAGARAALERVARFVEEGKDHAAADQLEAFASQALDLAPAHIPSPVAHGLAEEAALVVLAR